MHHRSRAFDLSIASPPCAAALLSLSFVGSAAHAAAITANPGHLAGLTGRFAHVEHLMDGEPRRGGASLRCSVNGSAETLFAQSNGTNVPRKRRLGLSPATPTYFACTQEPPTPRIHGSRGRASLHAYWRKQPLPGSTTGRAQHPAFQATGMAPALFFPPTGALLRTQVVRRGLGPYGEPQRRNRSSP